MANKRERVFTLLFHLCSFLRMEALYAFETGYSSPGIRFGRVHLLAHLVCGFDRILEPGNPSESWTANPL